MKTTIEIDNSLITNALQATGLTAQQEVVELALNLLIQMKNQQNLRALRGKLAWDGAIAWERIRNNSKPMIIVDSSVWIDYFNGQSTP